MKTTAINTVSYDVMTATHAAASVGMDYTLLEDATRLGGIASKAFRESFIIGTIAGILKRDNNAGAAVLAKKAPLAKDAEPEKKTARRAKVKAGEIVERDAEEQKRYMAATKRLSRFCATHSITTANKARGKPGSNKADEAEQDATPKANNAKTADSFIRQQAAMLQAYGEKNRAMLSHAMLSAIAEFHEAVEAVTSQD